MSLTSSAAHQVQVRLTLLLELPFLTISVSPFHSSWGCKGYDVAVVMVRSPGITSSTVGCLVGLRMYMYHLQSGPPPIRTPQQSGHPPIRTPQQSGHPPIRTPQQSGHPPIRTPQQSGHPSIRTPQKSGHPIRTPQKSGHLPIRTFPLVLNVKIRNFHSLKMVILCQWSCLCNRMQWFHLDVLARGEAK